jgi:hypothetical protein
MGKNERQAYLKAIRSRYRRARKRIKVTILDEFCAVCGYNRKYAIRLLNQRGKARKKRRPGRKPIYASPELLMVLICIQKCTTNPPYLHPILPHV